MNPERKDGATFVRLVEVMHRLRRECPWDREQTARSILPYLVEEAYEVVEAIEDEDAAALRSELGDLLLQVLFHAELAAERDEFDVWDVIEAIRAKMVRRHPHVFGDGGARTADAVLDQWSRIKAEERRAENPEASILDGVPSALPALLRAERLGEKASRAGFDWPDAVGVLDKVTEEIGELRSALAGGAPAEIEAELGDLLLALSSLGRKANVSAEIALRGASDRFVGRFQAIEKELARQGRDVFEASAEELEALWQKAKRPD